MNLLADGESIRRIREQFEANLARVSNLIGVYAKATGRRQGRPSVEQADILRAAVILTHATLEDLLRGIALWKLPTASAEALAQVPLIGKKKQNAPTHTLEDLASHRGSTVNEVIQDSVAAWLERSNFNNMGEVKKLLGELGLGPGVADPYAGDLAGMMTRRHLIAHRLDRNESTGRGHHQAKSIKRTLVEGWADTLGEFGRAVLDLCGASP